MGIASAVPTANAHTEPRVAHCVWPIKDRTPGGLGTQDEAVLARARENGVAILEANVGLLLAVRWARS